MLKQLGRGERWMGMIGAVFSLLGLILAVALAFFSPTEGVKRPVLASQDSVVALNERVSSIEGRINELGSKIEGLSRLTDESKASAELASVQGSLDGLQGRFTKIEGLIVQDPSKALEIPLLRKDLESIKESTQLTIGGLRQDLERAYTLLVGTMVALAIAVLAPAVSNLFARKQQPEPKAEK